MSDDFFGPEPDAPLRLVSNLARVPDVVSA